MRKVLLRFFVAALVLLLTGCASAEETLDWSAAPPSSGEVVGDEVRVDGEGTHTLIVVDDPDIQGSTFSIEGTVRHEDVSGVAYLEMWSYFADDARYFSRTRGESGPMAALTGDSSGREFLLPFSTNGAGSPERVELNVVLPEGGTVWVGPLRFDGFGKSSQWWTDSQSGVLGATAGVVVGLAGAVIGTLSGRRRARRFVEGALTVGLGLGLAGLIATVVALFTSQPAHVWTLTLLFGSILTLVFGLLLPRTRSAYEEAELHRIHAMDF